MASMLPALLAILLSAPTEGGWRELRFGSSLVQFRKALAKEGGLHVSVTCVPAPRERADPDGCSSAAGPLKGDFVLLDNLGRWDMGAGLVALLSDAQFYSGALASLTFKLSPELHAEARGHKELLAALTAKYGAPALIEAPALRTYRWVENGMEVLYAALKRMDAHPDEEISGPLSLVYRQLARVEAHDKATATSTAPIDSSKL